MHPHGHVTGAYCARATGGRETEDGYYAVGFGLGWLAHFPPATDAKLYLNPPHPQHGGHKLSIPERLYTLVGFVVQ